MRFTGTGVMTRSGATAIAVDMFGNAHGAWRDGAGELIDLPRDEQSSMLQMLASVGDDVSKTKPAVRGAYEIVLDAAKRTRGAPTR